MKYIKLYNYLRDKESLTRVQSIRTIWRVRVLAPEIKAAMGEWVRTGTCEITIAGVSYKELVLKENMKPVRAFRMLDWLRREPVIAHQYLVRRTMLSDLSKCGSAKVATDIEETDTSDIDL